MKLLDEILAANKRFIQETKLDYNRQDSAVSKYPKRQLAIVTCMDTRLVEFLESALGINRGDAKIIKTAGNSITGPFDVTIRSLLVAVYTLKVQQIMVIGHYECGLEHLAAKDLIENMRQQGVSPAAIHMVQPELEQWIDRFHHPIQNIEDTVTAIRLNPLFPANIPVHGLIFHPRTGEIDEVVNGYDYIGKA